eukprot:scaffold762_cov363-Pavlova_lutheri.AAC.11
MEYRGSDGSTVPAADPMFTMAPRLRFNIPGITILHMRKQDSTFTFKRAVSSSASTSFRYIACGYDMPTLLMRTPTSISSITFATRSQSFASADAKSTATHLLSVGSSSASFSSLSCVLDTRTKRIPERANSSAMAFPIPSVAPVTTAHAPYFERRLAGRMVAR